MLCTDECLAHSSGLGGPYGKNSYCQDGGEPEDSVTGASCAFGTDCTDCGPRYMSPPPQPPPPSQPPTPPPPARSRSLKRQDSKGPTETAFSRAANAEAAEHAHELRENEPSSPFHKAADAPGALAAATAALKAAQPRPGLLVRAASNLHHVKEAVHVEAPVEDLDEVTLLIIPTLTPTLTLTLTSHPYPPTPTLP